MFERVGSLPNVIPIIRVVIIAIYFTFLSDLVVHAAAGVMRQPVETSHWLAGVILGLFVAETWAFKTIVDLIRANPVLREQAEPFGKLSILWLGHTILTVLLGMWALNLLGIDTTDENNAPWMGLMPILVFRQLGLAVLLQFRSDPPAHRKSITVIRRLVAQGIFLAFALISYSVVVLALFGGKVETANLGMAWLNLVLSLPLFVLLYLPGQFGLRIAAGADRTLVWMPYWELLLIWIMAARPFWQAVYRLSLS